MLRRRNRSTASALVFNATPMVDVIFLLTIFFMLISRFASEEQIRMQLPKPDGSQAAVTRIPERVVINCRPSELTDSAMPSVRYSIGPNQPEPLDVIADRLIAMKRAAPNVKVIVRADRRLHYEDVRAIMRVIASCDIEMLNVVAHIAEEP